MNYPLISEYIESIKLAEENFDELSYLRPVLDTDGQPVISSGNFAVVFKMKDERDGKFYAVKCFTREQEGRAESYKLIADELEFVSSNYLTPIKYLENELFVDTSSSDADEFPVLLMDWVEGKTLDKYLRENLCDKYALESLAYRFSQLAQWLIPQPFAHGDLKPDNILVREDGTLVLVDYDGMYVPAMKGQKARELGSPDFRHPSRTEGDFDEHIDDFPLVTILLSLKAISVNPALLEEYGATDRLIFSEMDYRSLSECEKIPKLLVLNDLDINRLLGLLLLAYTEGNLSNVSFKLLYVTKPQRKIISSLEGIEKDGAVIQDDTVSILQRIMNERDAKFFYNAAIHYFRGIDMPQNYTEALECLNHAEDVGGMEMKEKCIQLRTSILAQMADGNH
jgi:serine/threonine protein kinase